MEGVASIQILAGDTGDTQKVTFEAKSDKISKADLDKTLGDNATKYVVKDVKKVEPKKAAPAGEAKKETKKPA